MLKSKWWGLAFSVAKWIFMVLCFFAAWNRDANATDRVVAAIFCVGIAAGAGIEECRRLLDRSSS